jgi:hypothetical protein
LKKALAGKPMKSILLFLALAAIPASAEIGPGPDTLASFPDTPAQDTMPAYEGPPYLNKAVERAFLGTFVPFMGGSGAGLSYAGAPRRAALANGSRTVGVILATAGVLYMTVNCSVGLLYEPAPRGCGYAASALVLGAGGVVFGTVYGFAALPGAVRRERARRARAARVTMAPLLLPRAQAVDPGLALRVDW